jgi:ABC-type multidrug transport system ATPase subunit
VKGSPVLTVSDLRRDYADLVAFSTGGIDVKRGELVALVGPNGAGKSTFMKLVAGLLEPTEGLVVVDDAPAGSIKARAAMAYLPDIPVLYDDLSLAEQIEYVAGLHGEEDWDDRGFELLERLGMEHRAGDVPTTFSRGMRQKAAIALAFVRPFDLLLADEPFDGLDAPSRSVLTELIVERVRGGAAAIVSTHRSDFLEQASRCIALRDGEIGYDGPAGPKAAAAIESLG